MTHLSFEFGKVIYRRLSLILLIATILLFPILIKTITHMGVVKNQIPEGLLANNVAVAVLTFSQSFLFIPVWMILLIGLEFTSGHVNRVAFMRSRGYYFMSKLTFTVLVTLIFSVLGIIAFILATETSPFKYYHAPLHFFFEFFPQMFMATMAYCVMLLCLVYWVRSPLIAFIIYVAWGTVEGLTYTVFQKLYKTELIWLPLQYVRTLYLRNGESVASNYYNPFVESPALVIGPLAMVAAIVFFTYMMFLRRNLKPLSD